MSEIPTIDMPYSEFREKYEDGKYLPMDTALTKSAEFQNEELNNSIIFGSIAAHPEIYGVNRLSRPTDQTLDFITSEDEIARLAEDYEMWSPMENCYFLDYDGWAVGLMPAGEEVFDDFYEKGITVPEEELENPETVATTLGEVDVISPEINYSMKARRYTQNQLQNSYIKSNDLADMASMSLREARTGNTYDQDKLVDTMARFTDGQLPLDSWRRNMQVRIDNHIDLDDWRLLHGELADIEDLYEESTRV